MTVELAISGSRGWSKNLSHERHFREMSLFRSYNSSPRMSHKKLFNTLSVLCKRERRNVAKKYRADFFREKSQMNNRVCTMTQIYLPLMIQGIVRNRFVSHNAAW